MLHQRLLPALNLITGSSSTLCTNGYVAATIGGGGGGGPRGIIGCFHPAPPHQTTLPRRRFKRRHRDDSTSFSQTSRHSSSFQLFNHHQQRRQETTAYGPVIQRTDAPTHLDPIEDAIHASLSHYYQEQQQQQPALIQDENNTNTHKQSSSTDEFHLDTLQNNILAFPPNDRETIGVSTHLYKRLRSLANSGDCRRCWLQKRHCVCERCFPLEDDEGSDGGGIVNVNRLFLLTHHKEICLAVDTAKLIVSSFPTTTRLVVSGIGREFQPAMGEMLDAVSNAAANSGGSNGATKCLILFPTDDAITYEEIREDINKKKKNAVTHNATTNDQTTSKCSENMDNTIMDDIDKGWDVIVLDGTWSQARKMHSKYFSQVSEGCLYRVQLSNEAVKALDGDSGSSVSSVDDDGGIGGIDASVVDSIVKGHQLRRHPIKWREISTLEATRLLLNDMHTDGQFNEHSMAMARYQEIGNDAARKQLGPPRV
mmetsp:Transcript_38847/g.81666  ORF Transcript_38847/g.81666 Transcript_38847/m.81666 type:complete len:482 (-) Transcript_38847:64-1509(-)